MLKKLVGFGVFLGITVSTGILPLNFLASNDLLGSIKQVFSTTTQNMTINLPQSSELNFMHTNNGDPVLFNTCETIPIVVSQENSKKLQPVLTNVVAYLNSNLGTSFKIIGKSEHVVSGSWFKIGHGTVQGRRYAPILVSLVDSHAKSDLLDSDKSAGAAITHKGKAFDSRFIVTGGIALNNKVLNLSKNSSDTSFAETVLLHEFAHILGLDHMDEGVLQSQINPTETYSSYPSQVYSFFKARSSSC